MIKAIRAKEEEKVGNHNIKDLYEVLGSRTSKDKEIKIILIVNFLGRSSTLDGINFAALGQNLYNTQKSTFLDRKRLR